MDVKNVFNILISNGVYTIPLNSNYNYVSIKRDPGASPILNPVVDIIPDPSETAIEGHIIKGIIDIEYPDLALSLFGNAIGPGYVWNGIPFKFELVYLSGVWNLTIHHSFHKVTSVLEFDVSFESGEQCTHYRYLPISRANVISVYINVIKDIEASDDAIIEIGKSSSSYTPTGVFQDYTIPAGEGTSYFTTDLTSYPIQSATADGGLWLHCTTSKSTPGGKAHVTILCKE